MSFLNWSPIQFAGWNLSVLVLLWIGISGIATLRFTPQLYWSIVTYRRASTKETNGGTVTIASLERLVNFISAQAICIACLSAGILAAHRERLAIIPLLLIPIIKLIHSELSLRIHETLLRVMRDYVKVKTGKVDA